MAVIVALNGVGSMQVINRSRLLFAEIESLQDRHVLAYASDLKRLEYEEFEMSVADIAS